MTQQILAIVARPYNKDIVRTMSIPEAPFGIVGYPEPYSFEITGGLETVTAATRAMTSLPSDAVPNQPFPGLLSNAFNYETKLFNGVDPILSSGRAGVGEITVDDKADLLGDAVTQFAWEGRDVDIYRGNKGDAFDAFTLVARMQASQISNIQATQKTIGLRDKQYLLYRTPLNFNSYAGTGDLEGDADVKGLLRPQAYGPVFWVNPIMIIAGYRIMQWSDREVQGVTAFYDGGSPLDFVSDVADLAALKALTLIPGEYATCNALALVRAGGDAQFGFRLVGEGDAFDGYADQRATIIKKILTTRGVNTLSFPDDFDETKYNAFHAAQPATVGFYVTGGVTIGEFLDIAMKGVAGWWYRDLLGLLVLGLLREPDSVADYVIDHSKKEILSEIRMGDWVPPRQVTRVGWQMNYGPQNPSELATGLATEDIRIYGLKQQFGEAKPEGVRIQFPSARIEEIDGYFELLMDADDEASRQSTLTSIDRRVWECECKMDPFLPLLDKTLEIRNYNKHGFYYSKKFLIVGVASLYGGVASKLTLWADTTKGSLVPV